MRLSIVIDIFVDLPECWHNLTIICLHKSSSIFTIHDGFQTLRIYAGYFRINQAFREVVSTTKFECLSVDPSTFINCFRWRQLVDNCSHFLCSNTIAWAALYQCHNWGTLLHSPANEVAHPVLYCTHRPMRLPTLYAFSKSCLCLNLPEPTITWSRSSPSGRVRQQPGNREINIREVFQLIKAAAHHTHTHNTKLLQINDNQSGFVAFWLS